MPRRIHGCWIGVLLASIGYLASTSSSPIAHAFENQQEPTSPFVKKDILGWQVHVDGKLLEKGNALIGEKALRILEHKLYQITMLVPEDRLKKLQKVPIYLEFHNDKLSSLQYHPSKRWLENNGHPSYLTKVVHIPRADRFVSKSLLRHQPMVILHELAHAFHDREHGFDNEKIRTAYGRYMEMSNDKSKVLHISGRQIPHYARTNPMEFFAEFTESYFGTNDFYPFVAPELKNEFPHVYELMEEIWGRLP